MPATTQAVTDDLAHIIARWRETTAPPPRTQPPPRPRIHRNAVFARPLTWPLTWPQAHALLREHKAFAQKHHAETRRRRKRPPHWKNTHDVFEVLVKLTVYCRACHPSIETIGRRSGCSRATVFRVIAELKETDWLSVTARRGRSINPALHDQRQLTNAYQVHRPKSALGYGR